MREFAEKVIKFLEEKYQDAYRYEITMNTGVNWQDCLELNIISNHLKIYIPSNQMFTIYNIYKNKGFWREYLTELIEK